MFFYSDPPTETLTFTNKKRHEVMCSCPFVYWYRQTPSKERGLGEHISRLKVCYITIAHTIKRKHKCSSSFLKFADFIDKDSITMLFLLTAFALESDCKNTNFSRYREIFFCGVQIYPAAGVPYTPGFIHQVMYDTYLKDHPAPEDIERHKHRQPENAM